MADPQPVAALPLPPSLGGSPAGSREATEQRNLPTVSLHLEIRVIELKQAKEKLLQLPQQCRSVPLGSTAPGLFNVKLLLDLNGNPGALGILTRKVFIAAEVSGLLLL